MLPPPRRLDPISPEMHPAATDASAHSPNPPTHRPPKPKQHICSFCGQAFRRTEHLTRHLRRRESRTQA